MKKQMLEYLKEELFNQLILWGRSQEKDETAYTMAEIAAKMYFDGTM